MTLKEKILTGLAAAGAIIAGIFAFLFKLQKKETAKKVEAAEEKAHEEKEELIENISEKIETVESIHTGNGRSDFDASISVLSNLKKK